MTRKRMASLYLCLMLWGHGAAQETEEVFYDGRSAKEWAADLKGKDPIVRRAAAEALYQFRPRPKAVDFVLTEALKDPNMTVRLEAANTLADTQQELALAVYRDGLKDKDVAIREKAAIGLGRMYRPPTAVVITLTDALQDPEMVVRLEAANSLYQISRYTYGAHIFSDALKERAHRVKEDLVRIFTEGMKDKSPRARRRAAELVGFIVAGNRGIDATLTEKDKERLDLLIKLLEDEDVQVRLQAVLSLPSLHSDPKVMAVLLEALQGRYSNEVRARAAENLGSFVGRNEKVALALRSALSDDDPQVRFQAARSLANASGKLIQSVPVLVEALGDPERTVRRQAASDLMQIFQQASIRAQIRSGGLDEATLELDTVAQIAVPALMESLKQRDRMVQWCAAHALGNLGLRAKGAAPALIRLLSEKEQGIAQSAAGALADFGSEAVPALLGLLHDSDKNVRSWAAWSLGLIRYHLRQGEKLDPQIIPALISALRDPAKEVRGNAADSLARQGKEASDALPQLLICAKDADESVRVRALTALQQIGISSPELIPTLLPALQEKKIEVRVAAAKALWNLAHREEAIPVLVEALKDQTFYVRYEATKTLGEIGPKASAAVPRLMEMLKDVDFSPHAEEAVSKIATGAARDEILNGLYKDLKDKDKEVCKRSIHALFYFRPPPDKVLPELIPLLKNEEGEIRAAAVHYLGNMREGAGEAIPAVKELEKDPDAKVRQAVRLALMTMDPHARMERIKKEAEKRRKERP